MSQKIIFRDIFKVKGVIKMVANLVITFQAGVNEANEPITNSRTFRNLNPAASNAAIHTTAQAISSLLGQTVVKVERVTREQL